MTAGAAEDPFRRAEEEYLRLRGELDAGRITLETFDAALRASMIEQDGRWWMLGANSGVWYVHDGTTWAEAAPPAPARAGTLEPDRPGGTRGVTAASPSTSERAQAASEPARAAPASDVGIAPGPARSPRVATRTPPSAAAATVLRGALGLALTLLSAGMALTMRAMDAGDWEAREVAGWALVVGSILLGLSIVPLFPSVPWGVVAAGFAAAALVGFLVLQGVGLPLPEVFWWFPDLLFACGLAGLLGSAIGYAISQAVSRRSASR
jgi:hypothetical protein